MKNRIALASLLALVTLASCGGKKDNNSEKEPVSEPKIEVNVPVEEGKVTFYFVLAEDSVKPADYASIFMTGPMTGWATGMDAIEMKKVDGSDNLYYGLVGAPEDPANWINGDSGHYDYQIVLGYNESSHMSNLGLQWNDAYKMVQETSGTDNPYYEWNGTDNKIDLGTVSFATQVATPIDPIANVTFSITLSEALAEGYDVCCPGSWNGWATTGAEARTACTMTPNEDRTVWTLVVDSMYPGSYEYQVIAVPTESAELVWDYKSAANADGNFTCTFTDEDGNSTVDLLVGDTTVINFPADAPAE